MGLRNEKLFFNSVLNFRRVTLFRLCLLEMQGPELTTESISKSQVSNTHNWIVMDVWVWTEKLWKSMWISIILCLLDSGQVSSLLGCWACHNSISLGFMEIVPILQYGLEMKFIRVLLKTDVSVLSPNCLEEISRWDKLTLSFLFYDVSGGIYYMYFTQQII